MSGHFLSLSSPPPHTGHPCIHWGTERPSGPAPSLRWVGWQQIPASRGVVWGAGTGLYLYFVLDVIPDAKHHNPEDGLRRGRDRKFQLLLHPRPHGGSGTQCPGQYRTPSSPPSVPSPPLSAHHRASPSLHTLNAPRTYGRCSKCPGMKLRPGLPLQGHVHQSHHKPLANTNTKALSPFALTVHVTACP